MDAEKVTEVELKELAPAEAQKDKDVEKGKTEGTKEPEKETKEEKKEKEKKEEEKANVQVMNTTEDAKKKAEEKEKKEEEGNVYAGLKSPTEDIYNTSTPASKSNDSKEEKEKKEEEGNVYAGLKSPTEDIYNTSTPASKSNDSKEEKEKKEEEGNVYAGLKSPTEDIYNTSTPASKSNDSKGEKEIKEVEEEGNVYAGLKSPTEDIYNTSTPASKSKRRKVEKEEEKENGDEEGDDTNVYCKLNSPSENVYMSTTNPKQKKDVSRQVLFKRTSIIFIILSVILMVMIVALVMKLQTPAKEIEECTKAPIQPYIVRQVFSDCGKDWVKPKNGNSCYYISKERTTWEKSRRRCQRKGADLVVIDSETKQKYLYNFPMMYWIGLSYSKNLWMWTNNTTLTQSGSYWGKGQPKSSSNNSCVLLRGRMSYKENWITNPCGVLSQYICQRG